MGSSSYLSGTYTVISVYLIVCIFIYIYYLDRRYVVDTTIFLIPYNYYTGLYIFSEFVHYWRNILPVRSADLHYEVRFVDIQWRSSITGLVQQQKFCWFIRLLEVWYLGHHRSTGIFKHLRRKPPHWDRHHILYHHKKENFVLHRELDPTYGFDLISLRTSLLPACRSWWKGNYYIISL